MLRFLAVLGVIAASAPHHVSAARASAHFAVTVVVTTGCQVDPADGSTIRCTPGFDSRLVRSHTESKAQDDVAMWVVDF